MVHNSLTVIQIIADATLSGGPRHVADLSRGLRRAEPTIQLYVICPKGWLAGVLAGEAKVKTVAMPSVINQVARQNLRAAIDAIQAETGPAILHSHGVRAGMLMARVLPKLMLQPDKRIYTEHHYTLDYHLKNPLREKLQVWLLGQTLKKMDHVIAVSQAVADFLRTKRLANPQKISVIPHGIALPSSKRTKTPAADSGRYRIGTAGSLLPVKGLIDLIEAMPLILQNVPQIMLEIVGEGPEERDLRRLIHRLHLENHVKLVGRDTEVVKRMLDWDIYLSASYGESFGLAVAEAMAAGLPVIAARCRAIEELVTPETGQLVAPHDSHELAKAVIDLLPQTERRERLGRAGRERIQTHFSLERMVHETLKLYQTNFNLD